MGRTKPRKSTRNTPLSMSPVLLIAGAVALGGVWVTQGPELVARGDGHGRGLGQNGAYDYAKEGWTAEQILAHYYEGTTIEPLPQTKVKVRLMARDDKTLDAYSDVGMVVAGRSVGAGEAVHMTPTAEGANVTITSGCTGSVVWEGTTDNPWVDPVDSGPARPVDEHIMFCDDNRGYRGSLGVALEGNAFRVVNYVDVEDYLLGGVPLEMPPHWADDGGAEALRAQAVAARSYAVSEDRYDYAGTCDTTSCQMYGGSDVEDERATAAVQSTAGAVLMKDGEVVHAEYSASSDRDGMAEDALAKAPPEVTGAIDQQSIPDPALPDPAAPEAGAVPDLTVEAGAGPPSLADGSPIEAKYREIGGTNSSIGAPVGPEMRLPGGGQGTFRMFTKGVIIHTDTLGAQVVDMSAFEELMRDSAG